MSAPIDSDINTLRIQANATDPRQTVRKQWVLSSLITLLSTIAPGVAQAKARALIIQMLSAEKPNTVQATEASVSQITRLFDLEISATPWTLGAERFEVPALLIQNLKNLKLAFYDDVCETSCRIAVDYVIVAAKLHLLELYPIQPRAKRRRVNLSQSVLTNAPIIPPPADIDPPALPLCVFPELELSVTILDPSHPTHVLRVAGRADWALGYGARDDALTGTVLIAVEAKRRENFGQAEAQLLTYLAILRELRINAGKQNSVVQGFFTDGARYTFMAIKNDGEVLRSRPYEVNVHDQGDLKIVYNFIVTLLETASRSTPTTSPVKSEKKAEEVKEFNSFVWAKMYGQQSVANGELEILMEGEGDLQEMPVFN